MKKIILSVIALSAIIISWCNQSTNTWTNTSTWSAVIWWETVNMKLATCLKNKWATFYWTTRCSHCNRQKELFAEGTWNLPFVDCDKESTKCETAGIKWYPTWVFADGSKLEWTQELSILVEKTWCK